MVITKGIKPAKVLIALYENSSPQGLGFLNNTDASMREIEAELLLSKQTYFDYLGGRSMKVDLKDPDGFDEWLYDRDNGSGAAQRAIDSITNEN